MRRAVYLTGYLAVLLLIYHSVTFTQTQQDERNLLRLAQRYERGGDYRSAVEIYERLYSGNQDDYQYFDGYRRMLMQLREYEKAIGLVHDRLGHGPENTELISTLGGMYYRAERREDAFDTWERLIKRHPRNMTIYQQVASVMVEHRLLEQAIEIYTRGRDNTGQPHLFASDLAFLYAATMNYGESTREYLLLLDQMPQQLSFVQSRIATYVLRNDGLGQAVSVAEELARANRDKIHFQRILAWLYREMKDYENAFGVYRMIDRAQNSGGSEIYSFAQTAFGEREYETAAQAYRTILDEYPGFHKKADVRLGYVRCLEEINMQADSLYQSVYPVAPPPDSIRVAEIQTAYDEIINEYTAIVRDYRGSVVGGMAMLRIGLIRFYRYHDLNGALETLREATELYPRGYIFTQATAVLGDIQIIRGALDEAEEYFRRLEEYDQSSEDYTDLAVFRKAEIAFYRGEFDACLEILRDLTQKTYSSHANNAIELNTFILENREPAIRGVRSDDALEIYAKAMHRKRQQRYSEAIAMLKYVTENYRDALLVDDALLNIGDLYFSMRKYGDAVEWYGKIDELADRSILRDRALMRTAEVYHFGMGDRQKAIEKYEDLITGYPRSLFTAEARKRIRELRGDPS